MQLRLVSSSGTGMARDTVMALSGAIAMLVMLVPSSFGEPYQPPYSAWLHQPPGPCVSQRTTEYSPLPNYNQRFDPGWNRQTWECPGATDLAYTWLPHYSQRFDPDWEPADWQNPSDVDQFLAKPHLGIQPTTESLPRSEQRRD